MEDPGELLADHVPGPGPGAEPRPSDPAFELPPSVVGSLPPEALSVLRSFFEDHLERYLKLKAAFETSKSLSDDKTKELQEATEQDRFQLMDCTSRLETFEERVREYETRLELTLDQLKDAREAAAVHAAEAENLRLQRDSAVEVRNSLSNMIETRDTEIDCLKMSVENLQSRLCSAVEARCDTLTRNMSQESRTMSSTLKERLDEQGELGRSSQMDVLKAELRRCSDDLHSVRANFNTMKVNLERQLAKKTDDLNVANAKIGKLCDSREILNHKLESLKQTLSEQQERESQLVEEHANELATQEKVLKLHKEAHDNLNDQNEQLAKTVQKLSRMLRDATDECEGASARFNVAQEEHERESDAQKETIQALKRELKNANDLLQMVDGDMLSYTMDELSPSAHIASKLIKSQMSITQAYDQLVKVSEELAVEKNENRRLSQALTTIVAELEDKAPFVDQLKSQREEAIENYALLSQRFESTLLEHGKTKDEISDLKKEYRHVLDDNIRCKQETEDLANQVCYLLKEIETLTGRSRDADETNSLDGLFMMNGPSELNSSHIITKNLVTFGNITELQANNQKLLKLIRELSEKREEVEQKTAQMNDGDFQEELTSLKSRISELNSAQDRQIKMINKLVKQRDSYRKMCQEMSHNRSQNVSLGVDESDTTLDLDSTNKSQVPVVDTKKLQYLDMLETQLKDTKTELNHEREKYRLYVDRAINNEMKLLAANEAVHKQYAELQSKYNKSLSSSESINEKVKILQMELTAYKKEIYSLTEKVTKYNSLNKMQQTSIIKITDDLSDSRSKLCDAENVINDLEHSVFRNSNSDLDSSTYEGCSSALRNIEIIKSTILEGDNDSISKLQSSLDEANRTCTSLRCLLQEEQDKYHCLTSQLYSEIEQLKGKIARETSTIKMLQHELSDARNDIESKSARIEELNRSTSFVYDSELNKSYSMLDGTDLKENDIHDYKTHINTLQQQLEISKKHIEKYSNIYECSEKELKALHVSFSEYRENAEEKLKQLTLSQDNVKQEYNKLENELTLCKNDLLKSEKKIKRLSDELAEKNDNLERVLKDVEKLSENAQMAEEKYSHEIILHSNDIMLLASLKSQLNVANQNIDILTQNKLELECASQENKTNWENREKLLVSEKDEVKKQLADLINQNATLHNQIQVFSDRLNPGSSESVEIGTDKPPEGSLNLSQIEEDTASSEQLRAVLSKLRYENGWLVNKLDITENEKRALQSDLRVMELQLQEFKLRSTELPGDESLSQMHSGVIRKMEELNAISDCYANLRKERDDLLEKVEDMSQNYKSLQEILAPTQNKVCELTVNLEWLQKENHNHKEEVELWKNRVNTLIKQNQNYPEDWKKIQEEHEALTKSLALEKESSKKVSEEGKKLKANNMTLEKQIERINKINTMLTDTLKKKSSELNSAKQEFEKLSAELNQIKMNLDEKNKENLDVNEKLKSNETLLSETRNKENQIKKIAKKYKFQYEELLKTVEEEKKKVEILTSEAAKSSETYSETCKLLEKKIQDLEKLHSEKIAELNDQISKYSEDNKKLQAEIETLRTNNQEIEDKAKNLIKQAKLKIIALTESKENLTKELNESKSKMDLFEQNKDENDVRLQVIQSQYDGRVGKLEKEKEQLLQEKQSEIVQLGKQIESLLMKINHLQRKSDAQPPKPSTSSNPGEKSTVEPPTANIKPMAGVVSPREGNRRVAGETPLASIKPMASHSAVRTAAVLPTSAQVSSHSIIHHQTPHTTGTSSGDTTVCPSSSHLSTEYLPSSSSVGARMLPAHSRLVSLPSAESTQDVESENSADNDLSSGSANPPSASQSTVITQHAPQQGVALVMPRMETTETQSTHAYQQQASSSSSNLSSTVTTSHNPGGGISLNPNKSEIQRAFKRPRITSAQPNQKTILKRSKTQSVESDMDQMPTSSQRDQEDDVNFSDIVDEENYPDRMYDLEENENDGDKVQTQTSRTNEEVSPIENQESPRSNEVEFGNNSSQDVLNRSNEGIARRPNETRADERNIIPSLLSNPLHEPQIETISSGNGIGGSFLMIGTNNLGAGGSAAVGGVYEDGDDSIVPSTPTLNVPTRNDGFGEAVRSPLTVRGMSGNEGRFIFNETTTGSVLENTLPDLAPQLSSHNHNAAAIVDENVASLETSEAEVGGSSMPTENSIEDESATSSLGTSGFTSQVEEGREAEASTTAATSTPQRAQWSGSRGNKSLRRGVSQHVNTPRPVDHQRPSPIVWNSDGNYRRGNFNQMRGMQRGSRHAMRRPPTFFKRF